MLQPTKILALAMLLVVAAPLFFLGGFSIKQKLIQLAMTEKLEQGFLQNITANRSEIVWVKKNKEAIVEGKLFDVKSFILCGSKIILTGLFDEDEIKLKQDFVNIMHQKNNQPGAFSQALLKFIFSSAIIKSYAHATLIPVLPLKTIYHFFDELILSPNLSVKTPPPNA